MRLSQRDAVLLGKMLSEISDIEAFVETWQIFGLPSNETFLC